MCIACFTISLSSIFCGIKQDSGSATTGTIKQTIHLTDEEKDDDDGVIEDVSESKKRSILRPVNQTALPMNPFAVSYNAHIFSAFLCHNHPSDYRLKSDVQSYVARGLPLLLVHLYQ